jgi:hypothetical protein
MAVREDEQRTEIVGVPQCRAAADPEQRNRKCERREPDDSLF